MKLTKMFFAVAGALAVNSAFAAIACSDFQAPNPIAASGNYTTAVSSCGQNPTMGNGTSTIGAGGGPAAWFQGSTGGTAVFGLQVGTNNAGVTVGVSAGSAFIPEVDIVGPNPTCQDTDAYVNDNSALVIGGAASTTLPDASPAGTYWVFVGDVSGGAGDPGCGTFTLTVSPTLPVKLQEFSVD